MFVKRKIPKVFIKGYSGVLLFFGGDWGYLLHIEYSLPREIFAPREVFRGPVRPTFLFVFPCEVFSRPVATEFDNFPWEVK